MSFVLDTLITSMSIEQHLHTESLAKAHERQAIQPAQIPEELLRWPQWVCWRYVARDEGRKPDKQPVNPHTLHNAGVHWPNTWSRFEAAYQAYLTNRQRGMQGIGFVLTPDDPYVAVDLDGCIYEAKVDEQATEMIAALDSYTEVSPSGHGLRILVTCPDFQNNVRQPGIEMYSHQRYVTITGHQLAGAPTKIAAIPLNQLTSLLPQRVVEPQPAQTMLSQPNRYPVDEAELWERIFAHDRYGVQHLRRFKAIYR